MKGGGSNPTWVHQFSIPPQGGRWRGRRRSGRGVGRAPCCPTRRRSWPAGAPTAAATLAPRWCCRATVPPLHTQMHTDVASALKGKEPAAGRAIAMQMRQCTCDAGVQFLGGHADEGSSSSDEELAPSDDSEADDTGSPQPRSAKRTPAKRKLQVRGLTATFNVGHPRWCNALLSIGVTPKMP